jgi:hypothetical protein
MNSFRKECKDKRTLNNQYLPKPLLLKEGRKLISASCG